MKKGFYTIMSAQFFSSLADNALLVAAIELLKSSGAPAWFVVWRADDEDPGRAWPETVSVSYNEAGRWLDAQEHVEQVPMPAEVAAWLQAYTDENYRPEPKKRRRPQSFLAPGERR